MREKFARWMIRLESEWVRGCKDIVLRSFCTDTWVSFIAALAFFLK